MILFCIVFALAWPTSAYRGVTGTTGVNMGNQRHPISALIVFSIIAIAYRVHHPQGRRLPSVQRHASTTAWTPSTYWTTRTSPCKTLGPMVREIRPRCEWQGFDGQGWQTVPPSNNKIVKSRLTTWTRPRNRRVVLGTLTAMGLAVGDPYPVFQKDDAGKLKLDKDGHGIATVHVGATSRKTPSPASWATPRIQTSTSMQRANPSSPARDQLLFHPGVLAILILSF